MLKRLLPQQTSFFSLFQKTADIIVLAATEFQLLLSDLQNQQRFVDSISEQEKAGDKIAHTTFELLHKTFITPFDRHDIHSLTSKLDDILDLINRCAQRFPIYQLRQIPTEMLELSECSIQCAKSLKKAIYRLHSLNQSDEILEFCAVCDEIESKAHTIVLEGERKLFQEETDFKQFYKLKEIYAQTKMVINYCQDATNQIKGIVLEYS